MPLLIFLKKILKKVVDKQYILCYIYIIRYDKTLKHLKTEETEMTTYTVLFTDNTTAKVKAWDKSSAYEIALDTFSKTILDIWAD